MSQRIVVGIEPHADWASLKIELERAGAQTTTDPAPYRPDAVVATLPESVDAVAFIEQVKHLPGVRYAEPDSWVSTGPLINS